MIGASIKLKHARVRGLAPRRGRGGTERAVKAKKSVVLLTLILKEGSWPIEEKQNLAVMFEEG